MKIRYSQLKKIVVEEMKNLGLLPLTEGEDLESVEDVKAKEIEPGDENQLEKETDFQKALKIKEAKLLKALGETRSQLKRASQFKRSLRK
jgi:hypothetical protein